MNMKKNALSAVLAVTLLTTAAGAAPLTTAIPLQDGEATESTETTAPAYEVTQRDLALPIMVWGKAVELGENSLTMENSNEGDAYHKVIVNVDESTIILDAVTGEVKTFADIKENEDLYAYVGPIMTRSLPPITTGRLILCNIPADYMVPTYAEVQSVTKTDTGVDVLMTGDIILHLNADTELMAYQSKNKATLEDIQPGTRLLSWYSVVAMSMPAQASPSKVMVFPYGYEGHVETDGLNVILNGETLELAGANAAKVEEGRLMVPVRKVAEALGCDITWDAETNGVVVSKGDTELYRFVIGSENATVEGDMVVMLTAKADAVDGVTFMALDDLISMHGLKLVQGIGF